MNLTEPYFPLAGVTYEQATSFSDSLSDVICWMEGFKSGGGNYSPGSLEELKELNIKIKEGIRKK